MKPKKQPRQTNRKTQTESTKSRLIKQGQTVHEDENKDRQTEKTRRQRGRKMGKDES